MLHRGVWRAEECPAAMCPHRVRAVSGRTHSMHTHLYLTTTAAWPMIAGRHGMAPMPPTLETTQ